MTKPISRKMAVDTLLHRFSVLGFHLLCSECAKLILPEQNIQFDHIHSHAMGGPHEYKNLRPIHYDPCHKRKSAKDVAALAKVKRLANPKPSRNPMKSSGRKIPSRPFQRGSKYE